MTFTEDLHTRKNDARQEYKKACADWMETRTTDNINGNFEKSIDNFLWWINEDKPGKSYIESAVYAWLIECNNFLNYRIESRKKYGNRSIYSPM